MKKRKFSILPAITAFVLILLSSCYLIFAAELPEQLRQQQAIIAGTPIDFADHTCEELHPQQPMLKQAQVYLLGEVHGVQANTDITLRLLRYLSETQHVRYFLLETGPATAGLLNLYLQTGNQILLDDIFKSFEGSFAYTEEYYELIRQIKHLNDSLPENKKLQFIGLDREQQPLLLRRYLAYLLPPADTEVPEHIVPFIEALRTHPDSCRNRAFLQELASSLKVCPEDYTAYLGEKLPYFTQVIENVVSDIPRDTLFAENFKAAAAALPQGKFFGQFGLAHITSMQQDTTSFAAQLADFTSVFTIELRYIGCRYLHPSKGELPVIDLQPPVIYTPKGVFRFYDAEQGERLITELRAHRFTGHCFILVENSGASRPFSAS